MHIRVIAGDPGLKPRARCREIRLRGLKARCGGPLRAQPCGTAWMRLAILPVPRRLDHAPPAAGAQGNPMNAIDLATVDNLVPEEKLELLERLWASLVRTPAQVPVTPSQLQLVRKRLAEHEADPSDSIGLAEALDAARAKLR